MTSRASIPGPRRKSSDTRRISRSAPRAASPSSFCSTPAPHGPTLCCSARSISPRSRTRRPHGVETFLVTGFGKSFARGNSFGNWFKDRCSEASLPAICSAHGLREAGAVCAAENGATEPQMMAIFGWSGSKLATFYARRANQKKMAGAAIQTLIAS